MITVIYFWKITRVNIPFALFRMAIDRTLLRRSNGVTFAKMLGCGKGETFTPTDADPSRWGCLVVIPENQLVALDSSPTIRAWRKSCVSEFRVVLDPIAATGMWSKRKPFDENRISNWQGPIAAITRARIKWSMNSKFWRAVPPVTVSLKSSPGLLSAIGIGEAPIGLQGTFSRWESGAALRTFAYQGPAHIAAIQATKDLDWYAEELFARFAIIEEHGGF